MVNFGPFAMVWGGFLQWLWGGFCRGLAFCQTSFLDTPLIYLDHKRLFAFITNGNKDALCTMRGPGIDPARPGDLRSDA